jgi:hypothetical protein
LLNEALSIAILLYLYLKSVLNRISCIVVSPEEELRVLREQYESLLANDQGAGGPEANEMTEAELEMERLKEERAALLAQMSSIAGIHLLLSFTFPKWFVFDVGI